MATAIPMYIDSDQILYLRNVRHRDGTLLTEGVVEYEIKSKLPVDGAIVTVSTGVLTYVEPGLFEKVVDTAELEGIVVGRRYYVYFYYTNDDGDNLKKRVEVYGAYS